MARFIFFDQSCAESLTNYSHSSFPSHFDFKRKKKISNDSIQGRVENDRFLDSFLNYLQRPPVTYPCSDTNCIWFSWKWQKGIRQSWLKRLFRVTNVLCQMWCLIMEYFMSVLRFLSKNVEPSSVHSDCNFFRDKFCRLVEGSFETKTVARSTQISSGAIWEHFPPGLLQIHL